MSSSEESSDEEIDYKMYKDRKEWKDIIPTNVEDNCKFKVVKICYSDEFRDVFDYFRTICEMVNHFFSFLEYKISKTGI